MANKYRNPRTQLVLRLSCTNLETLSDEEKTEMIRYMRAYMCKIELEKDYIVDTSDKDINLLTPTRPDCGFVFDGEAFLVYCEENGQRHVEKRLLPGGSVTSEYDYMTPQEKRQYEYMKTKKRANRGMGPGARREPIVPRHATLTISWPEWKKDIVSVEQMLKEMAEKEQLVKTNDWNGKPLDPDCDEIEVQVARGMEEPETLKAYKLNDWPEAFAADCKADAQWLSDYAFLRVQPVRTNRVTYRHTDDYMDAAEGYGEDVERETTVTERTSFGNRLEFDLK